ncbi:hypothetical protein ZIOFF_001296 [Zingiber officinale]|uniref:PNPLA domain-containing protein n=1 Tax=Zingiber officinale TaxID=94328 RepID=A0A8J5I9L3_ZINOF|nr:hypothetical protein ZIOFF_001296 [Zingiber officinale]
MSMCRHASRECTRPSCRYCIPTYEPMECSAFMPLWRSGLQAKDVVGLCVALRIHVASGFEPLEPATHLLVSYALLGSSIEVPGIGATRSLAISTADQRTSDDLVNIEDSSSSEVSYEKLSILFPNLRTSPLLPPAPHLAAGSGSRLRILSVDSGGHPSEVLLAAIYLARLDSSIRRLSADPSSPIADLFDVAAGSGSGGVLAAMLLPEALTAGHSSRPTRRSGSSLPGVAGRRSDPARGGTCGSGCSSGGLGRGSGERSATQR